MKLKRCHANLTVLRSLALAVALHILQKKHLGVLCYATGSFNCVVSFQCAAFKCIDFFLNCVKDSF